MRNKYKYLVFFVFIFSILFLGKLLYPSTDIGILSSERINTSDTKVSSTTEKTSQFLVEVSGAVNKPGVYEVKDSMRVNDLIILAGGLSSKADKMLVESNLNMAQKLKDQQKVFVPFLEDKSQENSSFTKNKISINSGSIEELKSLSGIGDALAKKIIENRLYSKLEDLLEKKILSKKVFDQILVNIRL